MLTTSTCKQVSEAVSTAREAVAALPHSAHAHRLLGKALLAADVPEDAAGALREALRLDPRCEPAAIALATLLIDTGPSHYPAAEVLLRRTLSHISSVSLMTCLGKVCGLLGKFQDAIEQLNTAISIAADPTDATGELENIEALLRESGQGGGRQAGALGDCGAGMCTVQRSRAEIIQVALQVATTTVMLSCTVPCSAEEGEEEEA